MSRIYNTTMLNALAGPARAAAHSNLRRTPILPPFRALHASSSALKKAKKVVDFEPEFEDEEDAGDLFSVETTQIPSSSSVDSSALNREVRESLYSIIKRGVRPGDSLAETRRARAPIGRTALDQYTAACETKGDLESLRGILRAWRVMGKRVYGDQATLIIRRCIETGKPELAAELIEDKLNYGITTIPDQPFFQLYSALLALPSPPGVAPSYYRSRKHSVALAQLVLRMRRKASRRTRASKGETSAGAAEEAAAEDPAQEVVAEERAAEDTINEGVTEDAAPSTPSKPKPIQLPDHTPLQSDPLDTSMSDAEIEVIEACLAALEQKGGRWGEAGRRILYRKKWDQFLAERKEVTV